MVDYLVVGLGLAGLSFCEQLEKHGKSFHVISNNAQQASLVAGGLYNPVILKRFTMAWMGRQQMQMAMPFYQGLEKKLGIQVDLKVPVLRRFASLEEQNNWFAAMDKQDLDHFLSPGIVANTNDGIDAPFGMGLVKYTGRIATRQLIGAYKQYLRQEGMVLEQEFVFDDLTVSDTQVTYKNLKAKHVVFAEGYGLKANPYFNYLPLNGTKGELLTIHAPALKESCVIKSSVFIIPLGEDKYRVGATYKWKDKTNIPTEESKKELLAKLDLFLKSEYEVVDHVAGIRPTVVDRRPLVGQHPKHKSLYVLNGFGSRGVLIAPYASEVLFNTIEKGEMLDAVMDIKRFTKKCFRG